VTELALLLLVAQAGAAGPARVTVESDTTCPAAAEVDTRLRALLPPLSEGEAPERAEIVATEGALRVRLRGPDGAALGERTLTLEASCADRANVVAVVIAAWEAQARAEAVQAPLLPRQAPPPPTVGAPPPPPPPSRSFAVEVWAGPAATILPGGLRPGGDLVAGLWGRRLGARLALHGMWPAADALPDGHARWTRSDATLELGVRARGRAGRLDAHAGFVAGLLVAEGQGFEVDHTTRGFSPGIGAGLDWSYAVGRFLLGADVGAAGWTAQRLVSAGGTSPLPRIQGRAGVHVGVTF
jgi:hypothetical protein